MRKAFTLLELIFVIVIIAILSSVLLPRANTNSLHEAAIQVMSHIRYTQHLAIVNNTYRMNDDIWYKKRWTLLFNSDAYTCKEWAYTVFSDISGTGNPDITPNIIEVAEDISSHKYLSGGFSGENDLDFRDVENCGGSHPEKFLGTKKMNIGIMYGISDIHFSDSCSYYNSKRISFDSFGRPLIGKQSSYSKAYVKNRLLTSVCEIELFDESGESVKLYIEPETGYAHL